jgi:hypothetical protein
LEDIEWAYAQDFSSNEITKMTLLALLTLVILFTSHVILIVFARFYMLERMQKQSIKSMNLLSNWLSNHLFKRIVDYVGYSVGNHGGSHGGNHGGNHEGNHCLKHCLACVMRSTDAYFEACRVFDGELDEEFGIQAMEGAFY